MKRLLLPIIATAALAAGCTYTESAAERCSSKLKDKLKDPESLQVMSFEQTHNDERKAVYRLDYNAKNGFGGYVGRQSFICRIAKK